VSRTQLQGGHIFAEELDQMAVPKIGACPPVARMGEAKLKMKLPALWVRRWDNDRPLPSPSHLGTWLLALRLSSLSMKGTRRMRTSHLWMRRMTSMRMRSSLGA